MGDKVIEEKKQLRRELRARRIDHAAALPPAMQGLVFNRPPAAIVDLLPIGATIGLYHSIPGEAPTSRYASWFFENGYSIALPYFADAMAPMEFRLWDNPHIEDYLESGPFGEQPLADAEQVTPQVLMVPLVGFTEDGDRMGQGAGHYDRWLENHPDTIAIGMAWDVQKVDQLPTEPHDRPLRAIITPTRLYGPF
ncbi:5-formyltetrahydrofolate cyclo-ligase [Altericroceibacterium spongiae]|uniref:5-formyltetrahydrofolate cyclo-ligase n=1 Tax=Altericroceibacterium spongiae TaxID=2320269 RepID=A0A420ER82_9SPHN|nr:5-formyltetrahydrofolate cyclo-ligase [Altericroceibacterium spongiae]RKF23194.1 5-formyltetrahydrofolate cyclo-ligase [Altericroceibacterium spongiae]